MVKPRLMIVFYGIKAEYPIEIVTEQGQETCIKLLSEIPLPGGRVGHPGEELQVPTLAIKKEVNPCSESQPK